MLAFQQYVKCQETLEMALRKVYAVYFSPTGTTEKAVLAVAEGTGLPTEKVDLTTLKARQAYQRSFGKDELVVAGMPVYGGRIPRNLDNFFSGLQGNNTRAIALVMYGNREYEDALIELKMRLEERGFNVIAGAAFIGEHTFSKKIATGRPNTADLETANEYGRKTIDAVKKGIERPLTVKGNYPYSVGGFDPDRPRFLTDFARVVTLEKCTHCGICIENCPWGAIDDAVATNYGECMRCLRCIRICPEAARAISDKRFFEVAPEFEKRLNAVRKEPELFLPG
jgi:ferredoxin